MNHVRTSLVAATALALCVDASAAPSCKLDARQIKWPAHNTRLLALDKLVVAAHWDAKQGLVLANLETKAAFGKPVALPASPAGRVTALVRTTEGFAAVVQLMKDGDDEGGRLFVVRFTREGARIGEPHEIAHDVAPIPMAGFDVVSLGTRLALLEETSALKHSQVQVVDLDGKALGTALDADAGRIGLAAAIGADGKALAVILRDREDGDERLRVLDVDKHAWIGAPTSLAGWNIYDIAPFGATALLFGVGKDGMSGAAVGADGKLGAWKLWHETGLYDSGRWLESTPDGARAYVEYSTKPDADAKETNTIALVQPDLSVKEVAHRPSAGFTSASPHVTASTIFAPAEAGYATLRCR